MTYMIANIVQNKQISPDIRDIFEMELHVPEMPTIRAGQFVMVYLDTGKNLLPRPISICRQQGASIFLVYKIVGEGTEYMARLSKNVPLRILGPLGNGFTINKRGGQGKIALVGAGVGIPPMVALANELNAQVVTLSNHLDVFLGFRDKPFLVEHFTNPYTTNGDLIELVKQQNHDYDEIFACGPKPMLSKLAEYAKSKGIPLQVSLEERMACGIGTCMGCVAETITSYTKICCEGPVFYSDEVKLDD